MVTITAQVTRDTFNGAYRVSAGVTAATNISQSVFVFDTSTGEFSRVATAADVSSYPDNRATALTNNLPCYRLTSVVRGFSDLPTAKDFADSIQPRLKALAKEHNAALVSFIGVSNLQVTSE